MTDIDKAMENKDIDKAAREYLDKLEPVLRYVASTVTRNGKFELCDVMIEIHDAFIAGAQSRQREIDQLREALEEFDKRYRAFFLHNEEAIGNLPYSGKLHEAHKKASQLLEKYGEKL